MVHPQRGNLDFSSGSALPESIVQLLEKQGELRRLVAKGRIVELGAPEMPIPTAALQAENGMIAEHVYQPGSKDAATKEEDVRAREAIKEAGEDPNAGPTGDLPKTWKDSKLKMDPIGLSQLSPDQLRFVFQSKGIETVPETKDEMIRLLSRDWEPSSAEQAETARNMGYFVG